MEKAYALSLGKCAEKSSAVHWTDMMRILRFVKQTDFLHVFFRDVAALEPIIYVDSDLKTWAIEIL